MTRYEFLLFLHIAAATIWVGGGVIVQLYGLRALAARDADRLAAFARDTEWVGSRGLTLASGLAFLLGVALVLDSDFWGFGDDWILISLVLFAITFLAGALFFGPEAGRIGKLIDAEGAQSPAVQARIARILVLTRIDLVVLFLIVFDMVVKPSFSDGWTIVGALVAGIVLAALFVQGAMRRPVMA